MWSPNGKVWSPKVKSVESKILTYLEWPTDTVSHAKIAQY